MGLDELLKEKRDEIPRQCPEHGARNVRLFCSIARGQEAFKQDELIQVWKFHRIQIIGKAAVNLSWDFHEAHSEMPWPQIAAARNVLSHQYFGGDICRKYSTISNKNL